MKIALWIFLFVAALPVSAQSAPPFLVEASFDVASAFPGQAVIYTVTAYSDSARDIEVDLPAFEGFWQSETRAISGSATRDGKQYSTAIVQVALFPQSTGTFEVPVAVAHFAETVFSAAASRTSTRSLLDVVMLPPAPDGFSGLVGAVGARFDAQPDVVRIGEPIDLTLRLQGSANLGQLPVVNPILPEGWRIYPERRETIVEFDGNVMTQARTLRWRAIADRAGRASISIPPIIVYTPGEGYVTLVVSPASFEVLPGINGELSRETVTRAIDTFPDPAAPYSAPATVPWFFWVTAPLSVGLWLTARSVYYRWQRYQVAARKRTALRRATALLRAAACSDGGLNTIESAVTGFFADKQRVDRLRDEAGDLLVAVESERFNPDGASHTEALARSAADLLRRVEGSLNA